MENPFNYNSPVSPKRFIGRWNTVDMITQNLRQEEGCSSHLIIGGRRFGKSSLLRALWYSAMQLTDPQQQNWATLPIFVSGKEIEDFSSEGGLYATVLEKLKDTLCDGLLPPSAPTCPFEIDISGIPWPDVSQPSTISSKIWAKMLRHVADAAEPKYSWLRIVVLVDEAEEFLDRGWTDTLFNHLRHLVYDPNAICAGHLHCVMTGSYKLLEKKETGSPLLNAMTHHFLSVFDEGSTLQLIQRADDIPQDVANYIIQQSGGHPFIAQYLLYHLWEIGQRKGGIAALEIKDGQTAVHKLCRDRFGDLDGWWFAVGEDGRRVYRMLASKGDWMKPSDISCMGVEDTARMLSALCYHGLVVQKQDEASYRIAGRLFQDWVEQNKPELVPSPSAFPAGRIAALEQWILECATLITECDGLLLEKRDDPQRIKSLKKQRSEQFDQITVSFTEYLPLCKDLRHQVPSDIREAALSLYYRSDFLHNDLKQLIKTHLLPH